MAKSDLERYYREQLTLLADLDWAASEDALVETFTQKCRTANLSATMASEVSREISRSKPLNADVADRIASRVKECMGEPVPTN